MYRVYCMDGVGRFMRAEWVEAESDTAALEAARANVRMALPDCCHVQP